MAAGDGSTCLVNALTPAVFRGEGPSSYSRPGRIPGSVNAPWTELVDPGTNLFRPRAELERALGAAGALGPAPVIAYCGGGISATVDLFALALIGRDTDAVVRRLVDRVDAGRHAARSRWARDRGASPTFARRARRRRRHWSARS